MQHPRIVNAHPSDEHFLGVVPAMDCEGATPQEQPKGARKGQVVAEFVSFPVTESAAESALHLRIPLCWIKSDQVATIDHHPDRHAGDEADSEVEQAVLEVADVEVEDRGEHCESCHGFCLPLDSIEKPDDSLILVQSFQFL